jgi:hypothetical protein
LSSMFQLEAISKIGGAFRVHALACSQRRASRALARKLKFEL